MLATEVATVTQRFVRTRDKLQAVDGSAADDLETARAALLDQREERLRLIARVGTLEKQIGEMSRRGIS